VADPTGDRRGAGVTAGDRANLPLASQPVSYLHADAVTAPVTAGTEPVPAALPLAAEPVLWPSPGHLPTVRPGAPPVGPARRPGPGAGPPDSEPPLPATGRGVPVWAGVLTIAAAGVLRTRRPRRQVRGAEGPVG
jgi:hypothetical protein